jgi:polyisoprenyl-teichoic acid--peptidoglycan teichoic acid transferase
MSTPRHQRAGPGSPARSPRRGRRLRRSWGQRALLTVGASTSTLCLLGASVVGYALVQWYRVDRVKVDTDEAEAGEPVNILLVGSDSREGEAPGEAAQVEGKRTDTIMVMRLDPASEHVAVLSIPRDLVLPIAGTGDEARINSAYTESGDEQVLIDTIRQNFGIDINHWVEVDFQGFRDLVDALGGVTLYFDHLLRDRASGLHIDALGCVTLDGDMALAYARSRKAEYLTEDGEWERDPQSDLSRIARQQTLMHEALGGALAEVGNPLRLRELVDIGVSNVSIDRSLGLSEIRRLADRFSEIDPASFQTASLPVLPRPGDELATVVVDEAAAEPILNVFRGLDPGEVSPSLVEVSVLNGTVADPTRQRDGLAGQATDGLEAVGFGVTPPGDDRETFHEHTTVRYASGQLAFGQRVARHITGGVILEEDPALETGRVTVVIGADFQSIHEVATPLDELPPPPGPAPGEASDGTSAGTSAGSSETTSTSSPAEEEAAPTPTLPTGPTTTTPAQVGAVPDGAC